MLVYYLVQVYQLVVEENKKLRLDVNGDIYNRLNNLLINFCDSWIRYKKINKLLFF